METGERTDYSRCGGANRVYIQNTEGGSHAIVSIAGELTFVIICVGTSALRMQKYLLSMHDIS
jgi:hypothetical protein